MFGKTLRELRKEAGLYIKDLADAARISVVYVSDIERERRPPPKDEIIDAFCQRLEKKLEYYPHELKQLAAQDKGLVELNIAARSEAAQARTFQMARLLDDLSDDQLEEAAKYLEGLKQDKLDNE